MERLKAATLALLLAACIGCSTAFSLRGAPASSAAPAPTIDSMFRANNLKLQELEHGAGTAASIASQTTLAMGTGSDGMPKVAPPLDVSIPGATKPFPLPSPAPGGVGASPTAKRKDPSKLPPYVPTLLRPTAERVNRTDAVAQKSMVAYREASAKWAQERDHKMRKYRHEMRRWKKQRRHYRAHRRVTRCPENFDNQVRALLVQWDRSVARLMSTRACGVLDKFVTTLARRHTYIKFYNYVRGGHSVYFRPVCGRLGLILQAAKRHGIMVRGRNLQVPLLRDQSGPSVPPIGTKPQRQDRQDLRVENADVLKNLNKRFRKKLKKLLHALAGPTYHTYLRLSDPLPHGHVVDYEIVFGRPAAVKEVGGLLDLKVSRTQLQMGGRAQQRVQAEAVEGGIEPTLVMPKPNTPI